MPRFSANLGFLYADRPLLDRIAAAARDGFTAVEMHWPYDVPAAEVRAALDRHNIPVLGINAPVGGQPGDFGLTAIKGREAEFRASFDQALAYAKAIGATAIHCVAGVVPPEARKAAEEVFVANVAGIADAAAAAGLTILLEPINRRNAPNFFLDGSDHTAALIARIGKANVKMMFDVYHVQISEGDIITRLGKHFGAIGHIQIAAVPSRAEPDEGEIAYPAIYAEIDRLGYAGHVGAEYKPRGTTEEGLGWGRGYGIGAGA